MERDTATSGGESGADYQVFLSFRGPDTRRGFTDCLYHFLTSAGIRVFRDDTDQPLGAKIEKILDAIDCSVIGMPIFSKEYASSKWCLRELRRMVELKKTIIPIFYDVTPNDVKLKTSLYADALEAHASTAYQKIMQRQTEDLSSENKETKGAETESEEVEHWKKALLEVGTRSGRELRQNGFGEFCIAITSEVLTRLKAKEKIITGQLVSMTDQVEAVMKLLNVDSPDVRFVGIHGMGGIGKTTLAKLVFNELSCRFEYCSFINDIRELSKGEPTKLQTKLLVDLLCKFPSVSDNEDGVKKIREMLRTKKVLLVLDDVDHTEQIDRLADNSSWFGSGSRIIITTRDKSTIERDPSRKIMQFEMMEMNYYQALQLFSKQAFKEDFPPTDYLDLSKEVISVVGKLPLALEIIGSHLHGKQKDEWKENIRTLARIPHKNVQKKLRLSYDSLEYRAQQVFLDIACFFNNKDKTNAMYMWEACKFHPESAIDDLVSMSLIKIIDHETFWMHDQLRDLGREIVCLENFIDFGKRSRLWEHKEAIAMLKRREGTRKVQALCLSEDSSFFGYEELQCLRNLRFLEWHGIKFQGDLKHVFSKLIWFSWYVCPSDYAATSLNLESLVILELSRSNISENWEGWSKIKVGDELKVLDLTGCKELTRIPDISKYRTLERLILEDCEKLIEIDGSIGSLKCLKFLNMKGCHALGSFPEELCSLDALEVIIMKGKGGNFSIPELIGDLISLTILEIVGVQIHELPRSIGRLGKLKRLALSKCTGINELPGSVGSLDSLVELDLSETDIERLPNSIEGLAMLQFLHLNRCKELIELPESIGDLKSLTELDLSWTKITDLPESIGQLRELKVLGVTHSKIKKLPKTIGRMVKLEELHASECHSMEKVPRNIKKLPRLRILDFSGCDAISKVPSLSKVSSLQTLRLEGCHKLSKLPKLPQSLTTLNVASLSLRKLPDFSKLERLNSLRLSDRSDIHTRSNLENSNLEGIEKLTKLLTLHLNLSNLTSIPTNFSSFTHLKVLVIACWGVDYQVPQLPPTLSHLRLEYVDVETKLPCLVHLKNLVWLEFVNWSVQDGLQSLGIQELHSLAFFSIASCGNFRTLEDIKLPKSLEKLWIENCNSLETMPKLSELQNLKGLIMSDCEKLTEICGLGELLSLEELRIYNCGSLGTISDWSGLRNLKHLNISSYPQLTEIPGLGELKSLETLCVTGCFSLKKLSNFSMLIKLEELEIYDCDNLSLIEGLNNLSLRVREIHCSRNPKIT
ncbi:TMV resistance protein N isoform X2 [Punica granatum]|uniref:TMV resistance protein N isoform X2 n=1 Tax=Punica granatum TaxID=22663 RepID=A0A6P8DG76_PUNGR|nr:TMV resistance protein N isoform X2 [Punica granatum]